MTWLLANGRASDMNTTIKSGSIGNVFDGNTSSLARTQSINPMVVTLSFATPKQLARSRVWFLVGNNRWRIETADAVAELDAASGSYRMALDWTTGAESSGKTGLSQLLLPAGLSGSHFRSSRVTIMCTSMNGGCFSPTAPFS